MSIVLAINTSEKDGEILLADAITMEPVAKEEWGSELSHSEALAPKLQSLCKSSSALCIKKIRSIYVIEGPGSFTGLRVGVNFAKALAYKENIPIAGINTLQALAISVTQKNIKKIFTTVDAQKNTLFYSEFNFIENQLVTQKENRKISIDQIKTVFKEDSFVCGSGWKKYQTFFERVSWKKEILFTKASIFLPFYNTKDIFLHSHFRIGRTFSRDILKNQLQRRYSSNPDKGPDLRLAYAKPQYFLD